MVMCLPASKTSSGGAGGVSEGTWASSASLMLAASPDSLVVPWGLTNLGY